MSLKIILYSIIQCLCPHRAEALIDAFVWRLSDSYIGPKSRTERPKKTKIGTEVAHVTRDSDTTFKVKGSKVNLLLMTEIANMPEQVPPDE